MRRLFSFFLVVCAMMCALDVSAQQSDNKITFAVDDVEPITKTDLEILSGRIISRNYRNKYSLEIVKCSFENDSICSLGNANFFHCLVAAYCGHHSLSLSPDIIWNVIAQGFNQHVNKNAEALRDRIVYHEKGKKELEVIETSRDIDWEKVVNLFDKQIGECTKDGLADVMRADFSTTGKNERIVSQITLMSSVKSFFDYTTLHLICGIPNITIEGTPDDWRKVLDKTNKLRKYELDWWVDSLTPILNEFIKASEGNADKSFWQNIVRKRTTDRIIKDCGKKKSTHVDGWFLKLMPYMASGELTPDSVPVNADMHTQVNSINFTLYEGNRDVRIPMKMLSGFVGIDYDAQTNVMRPKLGWIVGKDGPQSKIEQLENFGMELDSVPDELQYVVYEPAVYFYWENKCDINLPEWISTVKCNRLVFYTKPSRKFEEQLTKLFPDRDVVTIKPKEKGDITTYEVRSRKSFEPENFLYDYQLYDTPNYIDVSFAGEEDSHRFENSRHFRTVTQDFIKKNRRIPELNKIRTYITFEIIVEKDGTVSNYELYSTRGNISPEIKAEAWRLIRSMPKLSPAKVSTVEGEPMHPVRCKKYITINF